MKQIEAVTGDLGGVADEVVGLGTYAGNAVALFHH